MRSDDIDTLLEELEKAQNHLRMASKILEDYRHFCKRVSQVLALLCHNACSHTCSLLRVFPCHLYHPPLHLHLTLPLSTLDQTLLSSQEWLSLPAPDIYSEGRKQYTALRCVIIHYRMLPPQGLPEVLQTANSLGGRQSLIITQDVQRPLPSTLTQALKRVK